MTQFLVTGMSCAACSARVEKAVGKVEGVTSCSVSLLTNSMGVEGTATADSVIAAVVAAGYGASVKGEASFGKQNADNIGGASQDDMLKDRETPILKRRLLTSLGFLIVLMYFSMGHMMWNWRLPSFFENNHVAVGLVQLLLAAIIMVINQKFFISGFTALIHRAPNMDTLVAMGSAAAFGYSTYALFAMTGAQAVGDTEAVMNYMESFYFESAAMILTLITVGKMLEARSKGKTTDALKGLMALAPKMATVLRDGQEVEIPATQLVKGDIFVVRPGENIPTDGRILEGSSAINESALTGESIPVDKNEGDLVSAATLNQSGFIKCEATRVGEDTTLSQIIQMVSDAAATKAPIAKVADTVAGIFVPTVMSIAAVTFVVWLLVGQTLGFALARGISVLVISCPCALGLATPVAIMVGNGMGAKNGILFKTAVSLEKTGKTEIVVLDKTGTITKGEPEVTDILPTEGVSDLELLQLAYDLEAKSEHPLAGAIVKMAKEQGLTPCEVGDFQALAGNGLTGVRHMADTALLSDDENILPLTQERTESTNDNRQKSYKEKIVLTGGNEAFICTKVCLSSDMKEKAEILASQGKTPLFFAADDVLMGVIAVADTMKEDSAKAISQLQNMGIRVVMLTGDNQRTAEAIGKQAGVDEVIAGVLPDGKARVVADLKKLGKVAMVGDGINDAPALTHADIGIAIGAGADVAIDAADVVLMKNHLCDVPAAIRLSRATLRNIHENLFWAFFYNSVGIPLAAGVWIHSFGWELNPMFGAAAMSLSSFCVVTNALRLNLFKMHDDSKDKKIRKKIVVKETESKHAVGDGQKEKNTKTVDNDETITNTNEVNGMNKEEMTMKKTMKIEGMMCMHCEAAVKKALEALPEVTEALVSHEAGTAIVELSAPIEDTVLKKTVEDKDYTVTGIE